MSEKLKCVGCKREFHPSGWGKPKWCDDCKSKFDDRDHDRDAFKDED